MRLTFRILALFTLLVPGIAMACLNLTSTDLDGNRKDAHRDRKSTRLNSSHIPLSRMPSSA